MLSPLQSTCHYIVNHYAKNDTCVEGANNMCPLSWGEGRHKPKRSKKSVSIIFVNNALIENPLHLTFPQMILLSFSFSSFPDLSGLCIKFWGGEGGVHNIVGRVGGA